MKLTDAFNTPTEHKPPHFQKALKTMLTRGEKVEAVYPQAAVTLVFSDKRLMIIEAGPAGDTSCANHSIPYRSITHFDVAPAAEPAEALQLSLWLQGTPAPLQLVLTASPVNSELQRTLAEYVLNRHSTWLNQQVAWKRQAGLRKVQAIGLTGAAMLTLLYYRKKHPKPKNALTDRLSPTALSTLLHTAMKR